jgi:membrane protease YdiL (CAAX protease family)
MSNITLWDHLFFILIAIVIPVLSLLRGQVNMEEIRLTVSDKKKFYLANAGVLWIGAIMVFVLWLLALRPLEEMGFRSPILDLLVMSLTGLFVVAYVIETYTELSREGNEDEILKSAAFLPQNKEELGYFMILAISAGICEEIVYRGFLVNYLMAVIDDRILAFNVAVIFPAVIFGIVHMYQGIKSVLKIAIMSLLFSTIFIFSESLLIVVLLHAGVDIAGGILGMNISRKAFHKEEE